MNRELIYLICFIIGALIYKLSNINGFSIGAVKKALILFHDAETQWWQFVECSEVDMILNPGLFGGGAGAAGTQQPHYEGTFEVDPDYVNVDDGNVHLDDPRLNQGVTEEVSTDCVDSAGVACSAGATDRSCGVIGGRGFTWKQVRERISASRWRGGKRTVSWGPLKPIKHVPTWREEPPPGSPHATHLGYRNYADRQRFGDRIIVGNKPPDKDNPLHPPLTTTLREPVGAFIGGWAIIRDGSPLPFRHNEEMLSSMEKHFKKSNNNDLKMFHRLEDQIRLNRFNCVNDAQDALVLFRKVFSGLDDWEVGIRF